MNQFWTIPNFIYAVDFISFLILVYAAFNFYDENKKVMLDFTFGSVKIRKKNINSSNLTNIVSLNFFGGGNVPDKIRVEILEKTNPKTYGIEFNDNSTDAQN